MKPKKYLWFFTFIDDGKTSITISSDHPDFDFVKDRPTCYLEAATLVDIRHLPGDSENFSPLASAIHSIVLPRSHLQKVFTRVEHSVTSSSSARIPVFSYLELNKRDPSYCFAYADRVIYTMDQNYHNSNLRPLEC